MEGPLHGSIVYSSLLAVGSKAEVVCEPGYNTTGTNPIECSTNGSGIDIWSSLVPYCDSYITIDLEALREQSKDGADDQDVRDIENEIFFGTSNKRSRIL